MGAKRIAALSLAVIAAAALARLLSVYSVDIAWLVALAIPLAALLSVILDFANPQPPVVERTYSKTLVEVLYETIKGLPETENSLQLRLKDMLIRRLSARTGYPAAEVEAKMLELVKDEQLVKLLRGEVRLRSEREIMDLLERIDRL